MATLRLPLINQYQNRDATQDQDYKLVNCYAEPQGEQAVIIKRPGLEAFRTTTAGAGRGIYVWKNDDYIVLDNKVRKNGSVLSGTLATSSGKVEFAEFKKSDGTEFLILRAGNELWKIATGGTLTKLTDADIPSSLASGVEVYDTYVFVLTTTGEIHNSAVGDLDTWNGDFLTAEVRTDGGKALVRYLDYLVAFGENSVEFFYNAANASGSPLLRYEGTTKYFGTPSGASVAPTAENVFFVSQSVDGDIGVYMYSGMQAAKISSPAIDKLLEGEESSITDCYGYTVRMQGHVFYVLNLTNQNITLVFDRDTKLWHNWTLYNGTTESEFIIAGAALKSGEIVMLHNTNGDIYKFNPDVYQDDSNTIKLLGVTPLWDNNNHLNKFMNRLEVAGDRTASSANLSISWTDDDYNTFSTARTVDLSGRAILQRLGKTQRRAFKYTFEANQPLRIVGFDVSVVEGTHGQ